LMTLIFGEVPHDAVFSILPPLSPSEVQLFSSGLSVSQV